MKIASHAREIERVGAGSSTRFTIEAAGKAFEILSSGLYKDKILAIVRELSTNAYDAHVAAGTEAEPFHVHLPNTFEPHFTIRDYGIGLPDDKLREILTTYFRSTKTDSNAFVGALGLGFKSPFSFVDSFTIISFYNGFKRQYVAFKNSDGCPDLDEIGVPEDPDALAAWQGEPTTERNGLEIRVAVDRAGDHREFVHRAMQVYEHFDPQPVVTGVTGFEPRKVTVALSGNGWRLRGPGDRFDNGSARAIMGRIAYPINASSIQDLDRTLAALLTLPIDIDFELGTLEFTAGREELSYDKRLTIPNLKTALSRVRKDVQRHVEAEFAACGSEYEARKLYATYNIENRAFSRYWSQANFNVKWNGIEIKSSTMVFTMPEFEGLQFAEISTYYGGVSFSPNVIAPKGKYPAQSDIPEDVLLRPFTKGLHIGRADSLTVDAANRFTVYVNDLKKGAAGRLRQDANRNSYGRSGWGRSSSSAIVISADSAFAEKLAERLPGVNWRLLSELEAEANQRVRRKAKVRVMNDECKRRGTITISLLEEKDVDLSQGGFYVITKNGRGTTLPKGHTFDEVWGQVVGQWKLFDPKDKMIVVAPQSVEEQITKSDGKWVDLITHFKDLVDAKIDSILKLPTIDRDRNIFTLVNSGYRWTSVVEQVTLVAAGLKKDHPLSVIAKTYEQGRASSNFNTVTQLHTLAQLFERKLPAVTTNFKAEIRAAVEPYPLLAYGVEGRDFAVSTRNRQAVRDYINIHDSYRRLMQAEQARVQKTSKQEVAEIQAEVEKIVKLDRQADNTAAAE
jgi:hypothetical protein